jgi:hypothetical protein
LVAAGSNQFWLFVDIKYRDKVYVVFVRFFRAPARNL